MPPQDQPDIDPAAIAAALLAWYDRDRRRMPWRAPPGEPADPYHVWLSEIMLQQTTVAAVKPYFEAFLARWPTVRDLSKAPLDDVLHAWQGLGYYARARNLHKCAKLVARELRGRFPDTEEALRKLPGIGIYTAAAIAAIAFERRAVVVDGNVERVMARLFAEETPLPDAKPKLRAYAERLTPAARAGDYAQAAMDLGATICTPKAAKCMLCPVRPFCRAHAQGLVDVLPRRAAKAPKPTRHGIAFWLTDGGGRVVLRRRPEEGLLGGMMEIPSAPWREDAPWKLTDALRHAPAASAWKVLPGQVRHTFTHFHLVLLVATGRARSARGRIDGVWAPIDRLQDHALPTVMKKVAAHAGRTATPQ